MIRCRKWGCSGKFSWAWRGKCNYNLHKLLRAFYYRYFAASSWDVVRNVWFVFCFHTFLARLVANGSPGWPKVLGLEITVGTVCLFNLCIVGEGPTL